MRRALPLLLALTLATAAGANPIGQGFTQQYLSTLKQVIAADSEMWAQLEAVGDKLEQFYFEKGHFPDSQDERTAFREGLTGVIIANPYRPETFDHLEGKKLESAYAVPLYWMKDEALDKDAFMRLMDKPDPSWKGDPGSIFIVTNGSDIFLLWASSADRLPMRVLISKEQTPRMICRKITPD